MKKRGRSEISGDWKHFDLAGMQKAGIEAALPGHFSVYDGDSKMLQFANARRQQLHARWVRSPFAWLRMGEHIEREFFEPVRGAGSILISAGQMYTSADRRLLRAEVRAAQGWFPITADFFFVGGMGHLAGLDFGSRRLYQVSASWLIRGLQGRNMHRLPVPDKDGGRLLETNLMEVLRHVHPEMV